MLNQQILVSIVIVSYNEGVYLRQCVDSCLKQKQLDNFEIIIGDDGSSDNSSDIIDEYVSNYPDTIRSFVMSRNPTEPVIGSIRASNVIKKGLEISRGKYCMALSADDWLCDNSFLYTAVSTMKNNTDCFVTVAKRFKKVWEDHSEIIQQKGMPKRLYWSGSFYTHISCFVFRKDLAQQHLLSRFCDDTGMQYSLLAGKKWVYLDSCPFCYRQRAKSIMSESDMLELCIMEIMLLQDCLNSNIPIRGGVARFAMPLRYVFNNRTKLLNTKYKKYLDNCRFFNNNILTSIQNYDKKSFFSKIVIQLSIYYTSCLSLLFKLTSRMIILFK